MSYGNNYRIAIADLICMAYFLIFNFVLKSVNSCDISQPLQALIDIVALWGSIGATIAVFYPINRTAALLLLPHLGWISFATLLNFEIWRRNRGSKKTE